MATPGIGLRVPPALLALIDAHAERERVSRSEAILEALADRFMGAEAEPAPRLAKAAKRAKAPVPAEPREALAAVEARVGVRSVARLDTSMVPVFSRERGAAYPKAGRAQAKGR